MSVVTCEPAERQPDRPGAAGTTVGGAPGQDRAEDPDDPLHLNGPWATPGPDGAWWHGVPDLAVGEPGRGDPPIRPVPMISLTPGTVVADTASPDGAVTDTATPDTATPDTATPDTATPDTATPADRSRRRPRNRRGSSPRRPVTGLTWLLLLSMVAAFFGWVSAEPLWLALGRGDAGTVTVIRCTGSGLSQRCLGDFSAHTGSFSADRVRLLGVAAGQRTAGTRLAARMLDQASGAAYVGTDPAALHLRWMVGLSLVTLCGAALVWGTGALHLPTARARRTAVLVALAAPLLVAAGFLAGTG